MTDPAGLNIGSGDHYAPGWVNVDLPTCPHHKDVAADARSLPFPDGSFVRVYCGHVLEHLAPEDLPLALTEVRRVLAPGGTLMVVGPDLDRARARWPEMVEAIVGGEGRWPGDQHAWAATGDATLRHVRAVFPDAQEVPVLGLTGQGWPIVSEVGWQCAVRAE